MKQIYPILLLLMFIVSCNRQDKTNLAKDCPKSAQAEQKGMSLPLIIINVPWMDPLLLKLNKGGC